MPSLVPCVSGCGLSVLKCHTSSTCVAGAPTQSEGLVGGGRAMKLGSKAKDLYSFLDALKSKGERIGIADVDDKVSMP